MPKIAVLADYPTQNEVAAPFQGAASMYMKNALRSSCALMPHPLKTRDISYFYLSRARLQNGLETEVFAKKELAKEVLPDFYEIPYLMDTYISSYLKDEMNRLLRELQEFKPDIIVLSGKWVFYFFACYMDNEVPPGRLSSVKNGKRGPNTFGLNVKFRGSLMTAYPGLDIGEVLVFPIIPHAYQAMTSASLAIGKDYLKIATFYNLLQEGFEKSRWLNYRPDTKVYTEFTEAKSFLTSLLEKLDSEIVKLSVDLETTAKTIDTIGFALSATEGHAIPFLRAVEQRVNKYKDLAYDKKGKEVTCFLGSKLRTFEYVWSLEEEIELVFLCKKVLRHGNVRLIGQNFHYDGLFFKEVWNIEVHAWVDTMVLSACLRNNEKKGLAYLCSTTLEHYAYWKDDLNSTDSEKRWHYCAKDSVFTFALAEQKLLELEALPKINQNYFWNKQERTAKHVLKRMFDGLSIDIALRQKQDEEFTLLYENAIEQIQLLVGYELNIRSTPQIRALLIDCLGIAPILDRKRKTPTFGNAAMLKYVSKYPKYAYLLFLILEAKSIATYLQNFMRARLDEEGKLRSFIGVVGTKSYRFNSRKFLSGLGGNIMNWSTGEKISLVYSSLALEHEDSSEDDFSPEEDFDEEVEVLALAQQESKLPTAPNSKMIVIPSSKDKFFLNVDLKAGDLHLVAWMAGAKWVQQILLEGGDVYTVLGSEYYGVKLEKKDPRRQKFKMVCHACVTGDHEVLTKDGWVSIESIQNEEAITVWDSSNYKTFLEVPKKWNKDFVKSEEALYSIEGDYISFLGTQDHGMPCNRQFSNRVLRYEAKNIPSDADLFGISERGILFNFPISDTTRKKVSHSGTKVFCPQTSTGYFLIRRNGLIYISGNTNYLGMPKTIAMQTGLLEIEVLRIMDFYFSKNPEIKLYYQDKIIQDCRTLGYTENPFGARYYVSTTDDSLDKTWRQKIVALPAQGGVADWINEVMDRADENEPAQPYPMISKLQCHDAGLWEVDKRDKDWKDRIDEYFKVEVPFATREGKVDVLTIPWDISTSEVNYAKCK